ncbi:MAG: hypothetical protein V1793_04145 [Pseudomonadota bacterium]
MKRTKNFFNGTSSAIVFFAAIFFLFQDIGHAEVKPLQQPTNLQLQKKKPIGQIPAQLVTCSDPKVSFNVVKTSNGLITFNGTISNIGTKDLSIASEAQYIMNLSYPPKTYVMMGVSDILATKNFDSLNKGASLSFNCTYQIPDFGGWVQNNSQADAIRMFALRVMGQGYQYKPCDDSNMTNSMCYVEIYYKKN